jgi:hypothetical protein
MKIVLNGLDAAFLYASSASRPSLAVLYADLCLVIYISKTLGT